MGELALRVELRSVGASGGTTLRIGPHADGDPHPEWLRFDCFDVEPHWHLAPSGRDEIRPLSQDDDCVGEVFAMLERELADLLERAGAPATLCETLRRDDPATRRAVLREAERYMRHRPVALDDLDRTRLERRRTSKWRQYPPDVLPAWVAEMDFPLAAPIRRELERLIAADDLGYPLDTAETGLPEAFCDRMRERFGWSPEPERLELLAEVVQGLYVAVEAFAGPGEGVVVQTPVYPPFLAAVRDTGRRIVDNPLVAHGAPLDAADARLEFDLDGLARVIDAETRVILLCHPHNPSGRVLRRAELERIAALAEAHDLVVLSDEIHADLLYDGHVHVPFATLGPEIAKRTVTFTSASKPFNIPGLRLAVAHFGSEALQQRFNALHPRRVRGGIGLPGIVASIAAWRWGQPWLDEVVAHLQANRDHAEALLHERIPEIRFYRPEATYLAWLDCSALGLERPMQHFLRHGRVALSSGHRFGPDSGQCARLNFATSRSILTEVIDRMAKSLDR
jgi:cystathionine beta-lyase